MVTKGNTKAQGLSERQLKAIPGILSAPTIDGGCNKAGISRKTFYEWLKDPAFSEALRRHRDLIVGDALDMLKHSMTKAVETLVGLLDDGESNSYMKRLVSNDVIGHVLKARELEDLEKRIARIEEMIREKGL